jgi:hypothetical protein
MNVSLPAVSIGWLIALIVLVVCVVLWLVGGPPNERVLALIAALAVARLT